MQRLISYNILVTEIDMNMSTKIRNRGLSVLAILSLSCFAIPAFAGSFTYDFVRTSTLTNVDDAEGRWQFSGGKVYLGNSHVGYFVSKKRVSFGASPVNRAALETTIIWKTDFSFPSLS